MSDTKLAVDVGTVGPAIRLSWLSHGLTLLCLLAMLLTLNWGIVQAAFVVWQVSPTYSHCFFIIPISAFLIWLRRNDLYQITPRAEPRALLLMLPLIGFDLLATIASITEAQQLALIGMVQIIICTVLGIRAYRQMAFPLLYLFFLVPTGEYLVGPMQNFTAWFISVGLSTLGILHHTEGTIIELVNGTFRVAEACAGLRFLIATIAVGALFSYLNYRNWYKIAAFMVACVIVPVIANGLRALGIVLLAYASNNKIATGADHLVYGWGFSVAILAVLMLTGARFADPEPFANSKPTKFSLRAAHAGLFWPIFLACFAIIAVPLFRAWENRRPMIFDRSAFAKPLASEDWQVSSASSGWSPSYLMPDYHLRYALHQADQMPPYVNVDLLYYARSQNGHGLISSSNALWDDDDWHLISQTSQTVSLGAQLIPGQQIIISSRKGVEMVWWTFWEDGHFTTSSTRVKVDSVRRILGGHDGSALVAVSTAVDSDPTIAAARIKAALPSLENLPRTLDKAAGRIPGGPERS